MTKHNKFTNRLVEWIEYSPRCSMKKANSLPEVLCMVLVKNWWETLCKKLGGRTLRLLFRSRSQSSSCLKTATTIKRNKYSSFTILSWIAITIIERIRTISSKIDIFFLYFAVCTFFIQFYCALSIIFSKYSLFSYSKPIFSHLANTCIKINAMVIKNLN